MDLFKNGRHLTLVSLNVGVAFMVNTLVYYGLVLQFYFYFIFFTLLEIENSILICYNYFIFLNEVLHESVNKVGHYDHMPQCPTLPSFAICIKLVFAFIKLLKNKITYFLN